MESPQHLQIKMMVTNLLLQGIFVEHNTFIIKEHNQQWLGFAINMVHIFLLWKEFNFKCDD
jgi:hypothetical protein